MSLWRLASAALLYGLPGRALEMRLWQPSIDIEAYLDAWSDEDGRMFKVVMYGPSLKAPSGLAKISRAAGPLKAQQFDCNLDYLLLFTLGKTGTTTFSKSIEKLCGFAAPWTPQKQKDYPRGIKPQLNWEVAQDFLNQVPFGSRVWVCTFVRNPFERLMSAFFQVHGSEIESEAMAEQKYRAVIRNRGHCCDGLVFFDRFATVTGLSLKTLAQSFNRTSNISFFEQDFNNRRMYTLLLREEDIETWPKALSPFFPGFQLETGNEGDNKGYAEVYGEFKKKFKYAQEEVECILTSPTLHLYSPGEIAEMRHRVVSASADVKVTDA